jgi:hypothetical protein
LWIPSTLAPDERALLRIHLVMGVSGEALMNVGSSGQRLMPVGGAGPILLTYLY